MKEKCCQVSVYGRAWKFRQCFPFFLCQKEEDGLCCEVVQSQTRRQCSGIPTAQWKSPTDGARHASPPLHTHLTARGYSNRVEGWHCDSPVWGLNVVEDGVFCKSTLGALVRRQPPPLPLCPQVKKKNKFVRWKENSAAAVSGWVN